MAAEQPKADSQPFADPATVCTHLGEDPRDNRGAVAPPIYQSSTFIYPNAEAFERRLDDESPFYDYTRVSNPTTDIVEAKIAALEGGTWARAFASGMGAITCAINACVRSGAHVVATAQAYGPTQQYLNDYLARFGVETTMVESCDAADFEAAFRDETTMVYLESPTTGYFEVPDIAPIAAAARKRGITTVFDNSWATPYFLRPLELGCDLVVHSATKYIGGHSDVLAGIVAGRDDGLRRRIAKEGELLGATLDPFAAWLLLRGLRTLPLRMEQHQRSALAIARMLEAHSKVARVNHPGLESHPQHEIAKRQLRGYAGLFSFRLKQQTREATYRVINRLELFQIGVSWGGYESLVIGGSLFSMNPSKPVWLIRLFVGLEATDDLLADLRQALED